MNGHTAEDRLRYAKQYGRVLETGNASDLLDLQSDKRIHAMKALMWILEIAQMNRMQERRNKCFLARVAFKKVRIDIQDSILKQADLTKKDTSRHEIRFYLGLFL